MEGIYHYPVNGAPKYELFHLKTDPFEQKNKAVENPKQLKKMLKSMISTLEKDAALYPNKNQESLKNHNAINPKMDKIKTPFIPN